MDKESHWTWHDGIYSPVYGVVVPKVVTTTRGTDVYRNRAQERVTLIDRMKRLFQNLTTMVKFDTKETVIELNGVHIEAYPSHHLDSMRGLKDVSFICLD